MNMQPIRRALAVAVIAGALFSCGTPPANTTLIEALPTLREAVTVATGHPEQAVELMASPAHLRILVSDEKLANSDQVGRENAAAAIVMAAENAMASRPEFASLQVISVAIIHPAQADSHVEDVLEFRRGPNQRFAHHTT